MSMFTFDPGQPVGETGEAATETAQPAAETEETATETEKAMALCAALRGAGQTNEKGGAQYAAT